MGNMVYSLLWVLLKFIPPDFGVYFNRVPIVAKLLPHRVLL